MTADYSRPNSDELELSLFGPGYGESVAVHIGNGTWLLIDSCLDRNGTPQSLQYLLDIGVNPADAVALVVATHWHDDHMRGITQLLKRCRQAAFCCSGAMNQREFMTAVGTIENNHMSTVGSGVREIRQVFSHLRELAASPVFATANRKVFSNRDCDVWTLSPYDDVYLKFLDSVGALLPGIGERKTRIPDLSPNQMAVALWIQVADVALLLGSDLERPGWLQILASQARPTGQASVFKVPHHGGESAHVPAVWNQLLQDEPHAVLAPWRLAGRFLPTDDDVARILGRTPHAYITAEPDPTAAPSLRRNPTVARTLRESGIKVRPQTVSSGSIRLRYTPVMSAGWKVDLFGSAYRL